MEYQFKPPPGKLLQLHWINVQLKNYIGITLDFITHHPTLYILWFKIADMFIVCGVLYGVDDVDRRDTKIR